MWGPDIWLALANPLYCFLYNLWTFKGDINAKDEYKFQMALGKEIWFVPVIPHIWILCLQIIIYFHIYPHLQSYLNESDKIEISIGISYLTNHHPHPIKREKIIKRDLRLSFFEGTFTALQAYYFYFCRSTTLGLTGRITRIFSRWFFSRLLLHCVFQKFSLFL